MSAAPTLSSRNAASGGGGDRPQPGSALGKRPAERQGGPGEAEDDNEQVHTAPAVMHAKAPCHSTCTCTCTQFPVPLRTGAVCSGAESDSVLSPKKCCLERLRHQVVHQVATESNREQPRAAESSREQPRANESTPRSPGSLRSPMRIISCTFPLSHYHVIPDDNPFLVLMHAG